MTAGAAAPPPAADVAPEPEAEWSTPRWRRPRRGRPFTWKRLLWSILLPERRRIGLTLPGGVLVALALGLGLAAYNTGSNILFLALSLLLAALVLSGVWSALNFGRLAWRLRAAAPWRVGQDAIVECDVQNRKRVLPTYALWFEFEAEREPATGRLALRGRLDPGRTEQIEWAFPLRRRGVERVRLTAVGSFFPFGFLEKRLGAADQREVKVWPARVAYQFAGDSPARHRLESEEMPRGGEGADLFGLRRYRAGDSHRQIHWKASARLRQLVVRQNTAERAAAFALRVDAPAAVWARPEQFELLCSLAGTLAEDLFQADRLAAVAVHGRPWLEVRRLRDVETFLDWLAELEPAAAAPGERTLGTLALITFTPDGERGVCARLNGEIAARA